MTKDEIRELIGKRKYTRTVRCLGDDELRNVITEIYCAGVKEGYDFAWCVLEGAAGGPLGAGNAYLNENFKEIRKILKLCIQYENCDE